MTATVLKQSLITGIAIPIVGRRVHREPGDGSGMIAGQAGSATLEFKGSNRSAA